MNEIFEIIKTNLSSAEWVTSVLIVGLIISVIGNFITKLISASFLKGTKSYQKLKERNEQIQIELNERQLNTAKKIKDDHQEFLLVLFLALRSEIRTVLAPLTALVVIPISLHYLEGMFSSIVIFIVLWVSMLILQLENKKATYWAGILAKTKEISRKNEDDVV